MPNALGAIQTNLENSVISSRFRPKKTQKYSKRNKGFLKIYIVVLSVSCLTHSSAKKKRMLKNIKKRILMLIPVPECDRELVDLLDDEFVVINDDAFTGFCSFLKLK